MKKTPLKHLIFNAQAAILIAILAQFTLPLGPIPLTGQTFAVGLIATLLSPKNATQALLLYWLLGLIGLPVFAGGSSGLPVFLGPTGGYLLGFLLTTLITASLLHNNSITFFKASYANCLGALATLLVGTIWLKYQTSQPWDIAIKIGFYPFIIPGIIKAIGAGILGLTVKKRLEKAKIFLN
ncbi:biotin transporter BioY [Vagococcus intermedius]|uniref:Biotin transporter n=1 Tax=Vagococcus intermedius TaxID=2991418 RepID=A0AAF0CT36_9ENTE|nr:biotin transporter BioY [Vagococcus intermedius]WEG72440.1 biotin transporter BioY [Vagococcus intermedius]WEG74527.1 biotin transporter BioY [Vagococcus intermedius]